MCLHFPIQNMRFHHLHLQKLSWWCNLCHTVSANLKVLQLCFVGFAAVCKHRAQSTAVLSPYIKHQNCTISINIADKCICHWENIVSRRTVSWVLGLWFPEREWLSISVQIPFISPNQLHFSNDDKNDDWKCTKAVLMDAWALSQTVINRHFRKWLDPGYPGCCYFSCLTFL